MTPVKQFADPSMGNNGGYGPFLTSTLLETIAPIRHMIVAPGECEATVIF